MEAISRTLLTSFIKPEEYEQLKNCETLNDIKVFLTNTDYEDFMRDITSEVTVEIIRTEINNKLHDEWEFYLTNAYEPLTTYLRYCQIP